MTINKIKQANKPFTTFFNQVIQNIFSAEIVGVYCYLLSLPTDWIINKNHLMNHFKFGRDKLTRIMKWLNDNYLIEYEITRNNDGTIKYKTTVVHDGNDFIEKILKKELLKNLSTEKSSIPLKNRTLDNPDSGKSAPYIINNKYKINKKIKKEKPSLLSFKSKDQKPQSKFWEPGNPDYDRVNNLK